MKLAQLIWYFSLLFLLFSCSENDSSSSSSSSGDGSEFRYNYGSIVSGDRLLVFGGETNQVDSLTDIISTTDGSDWKLEVSNASFGSIDSQVVLTHDRYYYSIAGNIDGSSVNKVWRSSDGLSWSELTTSNIFPTRSNHCAVSYQGKIWVFGGERASKSGSTTTYINLDGDLWSSADGVTWTQETDPTWDERESMSCLVFNGKIWMLGGENGSSDFTNEVWSFDGSTWTQEVSSASWEAREEMGAVVYDGKIWIMGGLNESKNSLNDVWNSSDGVNWSQVNSDAGWDNRDSFDVRIIDNQMIVMFGAFTQPSGSSGAYIISADYDDVWLSSDGLSWSQDFYLTALGRSARDSKAGGFFCERSSDSKKCSATE